MYSFSPDICKFAESIFIEDYQIRHGKINVREKDEERPTLIKITDTIDRFIFSWKKRIFEGNLVFLCERIATRIAYHVTTMRNIFVEDENGIFAYADVYEINKYAESYNKKWNKKDSFIDNEFNSMRYYDFENLCRTIVIGTIFQSFAEKYVKSNPRFNKNYSKV